MGQAKQPGQETTDQMMKGYVDNLDSLTAANNRNIVPTEQGLLDAQKQIYPQQQQFNLDMARQYLPQFTQLGLDQQGQQQMGQARNDVATLNGPGQDLVRANLADQQIADPEFYKARGETGGALSKLYGSLDNPNAGLSPTERAEVERSTAQTNQQRGLEAPTATSAVDAAMRFGQAGAARKAARQQAINAAVQTAGNVMPSLKSGVDVLQLTTGRPSMPNVGLGAQANASNIGQTTSNLGSQLFSQVGDNARQTADINSKKRTAFDSVMQVGNMVGGLASSI